MTLHSLAFELEPFREPELHAMHLAGEVSRFGIPGFEFYLPLGCVPTRNQRAQSLLPLMRPGRTITGRTARWVHVGGAAPKRAELSRRSGRPLLIDDLVDCRFRRLKSLDLTEIAGLVLTTPERTLRDLRREGHDTEAEALRALVEAPI
ncbi:hypothetical protein [Gulosibacter chungangensis]|uniref:AbiEi antitoxin C-terminal domain-containing protein n=1 Tax=Gulosibacter chungangensis TaxID=979746 RepID=A0A7J5BCW9_9MICO|nr:hypothetical protein [Gulosibacter chungangensis]KAB1644058.1 hypothetical protein F8O05_04520 [Gulosibacter chungangensis]